MDNHQDEHIACADCGTSFVFSAGEAAIFQERGLTAPKRCKDCRRARKDRGGADSGRAPRAPRADAGGWGGASRAGGPPRGQQAPRQGPPRYTGDVNEYRSPMQDRSYTPTWQASSDIGFARPPSQGQASPRPRRVQGYRDGEYRSPSGGQNGPRGNRPLPQGGGETSHDGAARAARGPAQAAARRRPAAEMFSITCDSCGSKAEVPFKPAEGREVYCPNCYRARKPA
jgi:CxxC-x17-CxxC domain-containing protein